MDITTATCVRKMIKDTENLIQTTKCRDLKRVAVFRIEGYKKAFQDSTLRKLKTVKELQSIFKTYCLFTDKTEQEYQIRTALAQVLGMKWSNTKGVWVREGYSRVFNVKEEN